MVQAKKVGMQYKPVQESSKAVESVMRVVKPSQDAVNNIMTAGREGLNSVMSSTASTTTRMAEEAAQRAHDAAEQVKDMTRTAGQNASQAAEEIKSRMEQAAPRMQDMMSGVAECYNNCVNDSLEVMKDAMECHTMADVIELQAKMMQKALDNYFSIMSQFNACVFNHKAA